MAHLKQIDTEKNTQFHNWATLLRTVCKEKNTSFAESIKFTTHFKCTAAVCCGKSSCSVSDTRLWVSVYMYCILFCMSTWPQRTSTTATRGAHRLKFQTVLNGVLFHLIFVYFTLGSLRFRPTCIMYASLCNSIQFVIIIAPLNSIREVEPCSQWLRLILSRFYALVIKYVIQHVRVQIYIYWWVNATCM